MISFIWSLFGFQQQNALQSEEIEAKQNSSCVSTENTEPFPDICKNVLTISPTPVPMPMPVPVPMPVPLPVPVPVPVPMPVPPIANGEETYDLLIANIGKFPFMTKWETNFVYFIPLEPHVVIELRNLLDPFRINGKLCNRCKDSFLEYAQYWTEDGPVLYGGINNMAALTEELRTHVIEVRKLITRSFDNDIKRIKIQTISNETTHDDHLDAKFVVTKGNKLCQAINSIIYDERYIRVTEKILSNVIRRTVDKLISNVSALGRYNRSVYRLAYLKSIHREFPMEVKNMTEIDIDNLRLYTAILGYYYRNVLGYNGIKRRHRFNYSFNYLLELMKHQHLGADEFIESEMTSYLISSSYDDNDSDQITLTTAFRVICPDFIDITTIMPFEIWDMVCDY